MINVVDDTAKLLRAMANAPHYAGHKIILDEAARRCEAVADFVKAVEEKQGINIAAVRLYEKLVNNT